MLFEKELKSILSLPAIYDSFEFELYKAINRLGHEDKKRLLLQYPTAEVVKAVCNCGGEAERMIINLVSSDAKTKSINENLLFFTQNVLLGSFYFTLNGVKSAAKTWRSIQSDLSKYIEYAGNFEGLKDDRVQCQRLLDICLAGEKAVLEQEGVSSTPGKARFFGDVPSERTPLLASSQISYGTC